MRPAHGGPLNKSHRRAMQLVPVRARYSRRRSGSADLDRARMCTAHLWRPRRSQQMRSGDRCQTTPSVATAYLRRIFRARAVSYIRHHEAPLAPAAIHSHRAVVGGHRVCRGVGMAMLCALYDESVGLDPLPAVVFPSAALVRLDRIRCPRGVRCGWPGACARAQPRGPHADAVAWPDAAGIAGSGAGCRRGRARGPLDASAADRVAAARRRTRRQADPSSAGCYLAEWQ